MEDSVSICYNNRSVIFIRKYAFHFSSYVMEPKVLFCILK